MPIKKIKLPIIIDHPVVGRVGLSFWGVRIYIYLGAIILTWNLWYSKQEFRMWVFMFVSVGIVFLIVWLFYRYLYGGYAVIERDSLVFRYPLMQKNKFVEYCYKDFDKILWVIENTEENVSTDSLLLIKEKSNKVPLVENFVVYKRNKTWHKFIQQLSKSTGLPVEKILCNT